jgi:GTP cyclohydrolase II
MKTISELEAELASLKEQEKELWVRVQEQNKVQDALTKPWCDMNTKVRRLEVMIEARKEMEAAK